MNLKKKWILTISSYLFNDQMFRFDQLGQINFLYVIAVNAFKSPHAILQTDFDNLIATLWT